MTYKILHGEDTESKLIELFVMVINGKRLLECVKKYPRVIIIF